MKTKVYGKMLSSNGNRENFGFELQQNQRTLQWLIIMIGCRFTSV